MHALFPGCHLIDVYVTQYYDVQKTAKTTVVMQPET